MLLGKDNETTALENFATFVWLLWCRPCGDFYGAAPDCEVRHVATLPNI